MKTVTDEFGHNAGKIWRSISIKGPQNETTIIKSTRLDTKQFYAAVGWLARENKIYKNHNLYGIGETNLTQKIGANAGKIWDALQNFGEIDISSITRVANISEKDAYFALGWLAREDKINARKEKSSSKTYNFSLK